MAVSFRNSSCSIGRVASGQNAHSETSASSIGRVASGQNAHLETSVSSVGRVASAIVARSAWGAISVLTVALIRAPYLANSVGLITAVVLKCFVVSAMTVSWKAVVA